MKKVVAGTFLVFIALLSPAQQVTNYSFENWIVEGLNQRPAGWTTSNDFSVPIGPVGVTADSSGFEGVLSARIITTLIGFAGAPYAGFIVNGKMNVTGYYDIDSIYKAGEPFSGRPDALVGYYKYSSEAFIEDWGHAFVILKKYDPVSGTIDTVGYGSNTLLNPSKDYRKFRVPITYLMKDIEPDSIVVAFFSTYPTSPIGGGKLWIDAISLEYSSGAEDLLLTFQPVIYPNPVTQMLYITGPVVQQFSVYGSTGQKVITGSFQQRVDVSSLPAGVYIIRIETSKGIITRRFVREGPD